MTHQRIAITGSSGVIGRALMRELQDAYALTPIDRQSGIDLRTHATLPDVFAEHDALVHLAWQYAGGAPSAGRRHMHNLEMTQRVLDASLSAKVPRVIVASSVHADYFYDHGGGERLTIKRRPRSNDAYGASKLLLEQLCRAHASAEMKVVAIRFGGVTANGQPHPRDNWERRVFLSHHDCAALLRCIIDAPSIADDFTLLYAVSDNEGRVHDTTNPFRWQPTAGATLLEAP